MTLILALKCATTKGEGVLVCADSKATVYGGLAYRVQKIFPIALNPGAEKEVDIAIASGAGNEAMVRHAIRLAEKEFIELAEKEWKGGHPSFEQFEYAVRSVENKLITKLAGWRKEGLETSLGMILCGLDLNGKASIYVFDESGLCRPVHDTPGFACIGSGFVTGGNMILQQFWRPELPVDWAQILAAYTIQTVSKVDTNVGPFEGASWYFRIQEGKPVMGELKIESLKEYLERVRQREEILKYVWNTCDQVGENTVLELLKRKLKKSKIY
jgi:20S proteasome alpha/beta subunit